MNCRALFFFFTTLVIACCGENLLHADVQPAPVDFTSVAKKAIPAVVSVKIKVASKAQEPFGLSPLQDEIWEYFFRLPKRGQEEQRLQPQVAQASGFVVSEDGYILTNSHVVRDAQEIVVVLGDGREYEAKLIGQDPNTDVAVIKIDGKNLPHLAIGDSSQLQVGQWVAAVGTPLGLQASMTTGIVSAKGRSNLDLATLEDFIQTDAAINKGNSGGPLLNLAGEVIGINTAIASNTGGSMGIGFAIPSNMAKYVMNELIHNGKIARGYIGVVLQQVTYDYAMALGLTKVEGALVSEVQDHSPAAQAGLKRGDVIVKYNNSDVDSVSAFRNAVSLMPPGTNLSLAVYRNKELIHLQATVGAYPEQTMTVANATNILGIQVQDMTPELAQRFGYTTDTGVIITDVTASSPAAWVGLKRGALILEINQEPVKSVEEFSKLTADLQKGAHVLVLVKQEGQTRFIAMTLR